jgi:hypothetical protein
LTIVSRYARARAVVRPRSCKPPDATRRAARLKYSDSVRERLLPMSEEAMTTFDKREEGFEKQFAVDEELRFKATARRNKLLGLWAAEKLGLSGAEADSYALAIVMADLEGSHDVAQKIRKDFDAKGVAQSDHQISRTMTELMAKAVADIQAGK